MVLSLGTAVFAADVVITAIPDSVSVTASEKDMISELQKIPEEELLANGFSAAEIARIKISTDQTVLADARQCTDSELYERGLTEQQIKIIRTEKSVARAASEVYGKVTYTITKQSYTYSSSKTTLKIKASWKWSVSPAVTFTDIIAMTTSNSRFLKTSVSGTVNYRLGSAGQAKRTDSIDVNTSGSGTGVYGRFPMSKTFTDTTHPRPTKIVAFDGSISATFVATGTKVSSLGISANYGHTLVSVTPGVSFGGGVASISFTPTISIGFGPEAYERITL